MTFNILSTVWEVRFVPYNFVGFQLADAIGLCDYVNNIVYISKDISIQETRTTIIHEVTHAFHKQLTNTMPINDKEDLAFFMSAYADQIVAITNRIMSEVEK